MKKRAAYVAFDFDDIGVKQGLIAESMRPECPWKFVDNSITTALPEKWTMEARRLILASDVVIVLCGEQSHQAKGVAIEVQLAQELSKPYFLLSGTRQGTPTKPKHARAGDRIWTYRWPTVQALLEGRTPPADAAVR